MADPAVAIYLDESLNILSDLTPEIAFDDILAVDDLANTVDLVIAEIPHARIGANA